MSRQNKIIAEFEKAYKTEIAGHLFYTAAAGIISDEKGSNVFKHLAAEELQHIAVVSSIADSVKSGKGWMNYNDAVKGGAHINTEALPIFPERDILVKKLKSNPTDINAITIAVESEETAVEFYSNLLKDAETAVEKVVLTTLLEMEKNHLKILRWENESLKNTGFWCGDMEYSVEKEAD